MTTSLSPFQIIELVTLIAILTFNLIVLVVHFRSHFVFRCHPIFINRSATVSGHFPTILSIYLIFACGIPTLCLVYLFVPIRFSSRNTFTSESLEFAVPLTINLTILMCLDTYFVMCRWYFAKHLKSQLRALSIKGVLPYWLTFLFIMIGLLNLVWFIQFEIWLAMLIIYSITSLTMSHRFFSIVNASFSMALKPLGFDIYKREISSVRIGTGTTMLATTATTTGAFGFFLLHSLTHVPKNQRPNGKFGIISLTILSDISRFFYIFLLVGNTLSTWIWSCCFMDNRVTYTWMCCCGAQETPRCWMKFLNCFFCLPSDDDDDLIEPKSRSEQSHLNPLPSFHGTKPHHVPNSSVGVSDMTRTEDSELDDEELELAMEKVRVRASSAGSVDQMPKKPRKNAGGFRLGATLTSDPSNGGLAPSDTWANSSVKVSSSFLVDLLPIEDENAGEEFDLDRTETEEKGDVVRSITLPGVQTMHHMKDSIAFTIHERNSITGEVSTPHTPGTSDSNTEFQPPIEFDIRHRVPSQTVSHTQRLSSPSPETIDRRLVPTHSQEFFEAIRSAIYVNHQTVIDEVESARRKARPSLFSPARTIEFERMNSNEARQFNLVWHVGKLAAHAREQKKIARLQRGRADKLVLMRPLSSPVPGTEEHLPTIFSDEEFENESVSSLSDSDFGRIGFVKKDTKRTDPIDPNSEPSRTRTDFLRISPQPSMESMQFQEATESQTTALEFLQFFDRNGLNTTHSSSSHTQHLIRDTIRTLRFTQRHFSVKEAMKELGVSEFVEEREESKSQSMEMTTTTTTETPSATTTDDGVAGTDGSTSSSSLQMRKNGSNLGKKHRLPMIVSGRVLGE